MLLLFYQEEYIFVQNKKTYKLNQAFENFCLQIRVQEKKSLMQFEMFVQHFFRFDLKHLIVVGNFSYPFIYPGCAFAHVVWIWFFAIRSPLVYHREVITVRNSFEVRYLLLCFNCCWVLRKVESTFVRASSRQNKKNYSCTKCMETIVTCWSNKNRTEFKINNFTCRFLGNSNFEIQFTLFLL